MNGYQPAFPRTLLYADEDGATNAMSYSIMAGMNLRTWLTGMAISGSALTLNRREVQLIASDAVALADAVLAELTKNPRESRDDKR